MNVGKGVQVNSLKYINKILFKISVTIIREWTTGNIEKKNVSTYIRYYNYRHT